MIDLVASSWSDVAIGLLALAGAALGAGALVLTSLSYRKQAALHKTAALTEPRVAAYNLIVKEFRRYGDENSRPVEVPYAERRELATTMQAWYYEQGGWLMDGNTFNSYRTARQTLLTERINKKSVFDALSALRTEMKIELGVRESSERDKALPESEARKY